MHKKQITRLLAMVLSIMMILSLVVVPAGAARPMGSGDVAEVPAGEDAGAHLSAVSRPAVNTEPAVEEFAADATEVDVWDFGAEQLTSTAEYTFNNHLTVDVINSWYPAEDSKGNPITPGSAGVSFPSTGMPDTAGLSYSTAGASNHRLRTDNTALTRDQSDTGTGDGKDPYVLELDGEGNPVGATYHGDLYSNSAANPAVHYALECVAGDTVTLIVSSNGTDSLIQFSKAGAPAANPDDPAEPDVVEASDVFTRASRTKPQTMVFHAKETGTYKLCSVNEKIVVYRIYREHAVDVAVSGKVTEAAGMPEGYSLVFTNTTTGAETVMTVSQGAYSGTLKAPYTYEVSLKDANGFAVLVGSEITVEKTDANVKHNVITQGVDRFTVSGAITGLDAAAAAKLAEGNLLFTPTGDGIVYIPQAEVTVAEDGSVSYTVEVEKDMPVSISAVKLNDWEITTADVTDKVFTADTTLDLTFAKKAVWPVTITTTGMTAADLAGTKFTFTNLHEAGETEDQVAVPFNPYSDSNLTGSIYNYAYTFTGTDGIALRDGTYDVTVDDPHQKATANLVVNGAAATLTIPFKTPAPYVSNGVHDFTPNGVTLAMVDGISGDPTQFKPHNSGHGLAGKGDITISLAEPSNITISGCCYSQVSGTLLVPTATAGGEAVEVKTTVEGEANKTDPEYVIENVEGDVVITFPATGTSYIHKITVEAAVMPTIAADDYKFGAFEGYAQGDAVTSPVDGLAFGGSAKWWNTSDGMKFDNGTMTVNMKEKGTITVTGCTYSGDKTLASVTSDVGTVTLDESGSDPVYTIADAEGLVTITLPNNNTYIHGIKVEYPTVTYYGTEWDFKNDSKTEDYYYDTGAGNDGKTVVSESGVGSLTVAGGKFVYHGSAYGSTGNGYKISVPVMTACTVNVDVGYTWSIWGPGYAEHTTAETADVKQGSDQGHQTLAFVYEGTDPGVVEINAVAGDTTYVKAIHVVYDSSVELPEPPATDDIVYHVGASRTADGATEFTTITDALTAAEQAKRAPGQRITIEIDPGNYEEQLYIKVKDLTMKNAKADQATLELKNKGVDIGDNEVRITWYYGHGYNYYSMTNGHRYNADVLAANQANGYPSYKNAGSGSTDDSYWNASVLLAADNFKAEGIIFENSFNQYVSAKSVVDTIEAQGAQAKEGNVPRATMKTVGDTKVQEKAYVERAGALSIKSGTNIFFDHCAFISRQDTFYGVEGSKVACYDCDIYGGTDYIYGGMTLVAAKCDLLFNTSEDNNDVGYITAAQQKSQRGYLMYNCTVDSTTPGVNTASAYRSKPGYFGRPWESNTGEAVFYATDIKATDPVYFGVPLDNQTDHSTSLICPVGWSSSLGGESTKSAELGTVEFYDDVNNTAKRVSWATVPGQAPTVADFLGDWDPFEGKDMTVSNQTPTTAPAAAKPVTEIKITTTPKDLLVGEKLQLVATVTPDDATDKTLDWTSSDLSVATVSETGEVTAVAGGVVDITASSKNHMVNDHIRLTVVIPVSGVTLNKSAINMGAGRSTTLTATVAPDNATNKAVTWASSDEAVVTVDQTGKVKAVNEGTAKITVTTDDGAKIAECNVTIVGTVPVPPSEDPTVEELEEAIAAAEATAAEAVVSADGTDVMVGDKWVTEAEMKAYTDAIEAAKAVAEAQEPTAEELADALEALAAATETFEAAKKDGTATPADALKAAIKIAEKLADDTKVSEDGTDVKKTEMWVIQDVMDDFKAAIEAAQTVADNADATDEMLAEALAALATATEAFEDASKEGTKKSSFSGSNPTNPTVPTTVKKTNDKGDVATITTQPNGDKAITVVNKDGETVAEIELPATIPAAKTKFKDVPDDFWAVKEINDMAGLGMVKGINEANDLFDTDASMNRASVATMFFRLANGKTGLESAFADMQGHWAADAVAWAAKTGVVNGYDAETFGPNDVITRQQLAVMLCRFANLVGLDTKAHTSALDIFTDADQAADWAADSLAWCVKNGVMKGRGGDILDPQTDITRTEATVMFDRVIGLMK